MTTKKQVDEHEEALLSVARGQRILYPNQALALAALYLGAKLEALTKEAHAGADVLRDLSNCVYDGTFGVRQVGR